MKSGVCDYHDGVPLVGVDMLAQDGKTFAHGHFDIETAREFHRQLGEAIEIADRSTAKTH